MSSRAFYWCALALPIVVLALTVASSAKYRHEDSTPGSDIYQMSVALVIGSIPYGLLAVGLGWWMRKKTETEIRRMSYLAPIITLAIYWLCWLSYGIVEDYLFRDPGQLSGLMTVSLYFLMGTYAYVLAMDGLRALLRKVGVVR